MRVTSSKLVSGSEIAQALSIRQHAKSFGGEMAKLLHSYDVRKW